MTKEELLFWINRFRLFFSPYVNRKRVTGLPEEEVNQAYREIYNLIESSGKRTVSREGALAWWKGIHKMGIKSGGNQFLVYLRSLGISIDEPKGGGGGER